MNPTTTISVLIKCKDEAYSYYSPGQYATTNLVKKITYADNSTLSYTYNANNNIIAVTDENSKRISYKYDGMGQLIRENNPYTNRTTVYSYDKGGNITSAKEYAYTTAAELGTVKKTNTYTYGDSNWKDKLTAYNGKTITYDKIGNPLTYRDSLSFTWKNGRQLATLQNGSSVINYTYNADGVRIGKSGSRAGTFIVSGTQILREINSVATIDYLYDENGSPIGLTYKGKTYYYRKNLQGDIINITDSTGAKVVTYTYNAWGKLMSMTGNMELAVNNPFRYRGYYYDVESGLYYLNSRYYDPQTGRFINADSYVSTGQGITGTNMFAYCANDPINCVDSSGLFWAELWSGFKSVVRTAIHIGAGVIKAFGVDTAGIGAYWLNMSKDSNGIYHANFDCWQWLAGYNDFYDFMFDIGTYMIPYKDSFKYNDVVYTIWAWKGDYINLGAGAELGIYVGEGPHLFVDKSVAMPMQMLLSKKSNVDGTTRTIIDYKDGGSQWWCTGFNPNESATNPRLLRAVFVLSFTNYAMYDAFCYANLSGNWIYFNSSHTAVFIF